MEREEVVLKWGSCFSVCTSQRLINLELNLSRSGSGPASTSRLLIARSLRLLVYMPTVLITRSKFAGPVPKSNVVTGTLC